MTREKRVAVFFKPEQSISVDEVDTAALAKAVIDYMESLSRGNYTPKLPEEDFGAKVKSSFIKKLLMSSSVSFLLSDIPDLVDASVSSIVNLAASLNLLEKVFTLAPESDKLLELEHERIELCANVGMPGPSLIYIDSIMYSMHHDPITKIGAISQVMYALESKLEDFDALTYVAFTSGLQKLSAMIQALSSQQKEVFLDDIERFEALDKKYSSETINFTAIEKCMEIIWGKLGININPAITINDVTLNKPQSPTNI